MKRRLGNMDIFHLVENVVMTPSEEISETLKWIKLKVLLTADRVIVVLAGSEWEYHRDPADRCDKY